MKRPTTDAIQKMAEDYYRWDECGRYIPAAATEWLMFQMMETFSGIYCGTMPEKHGIQMFIVRSAKTGKVFCKSRVK